MLAELMNTAAVALLALLLPAAAAAALAQDTAGTGAIAGVVRTDAAMVADAAVCIPVLGRCEVSDAGGAFRFTDLRAGDYALEVVAGSRPVLPFSATVRAGLETVIDITLPDLEALTETVVVSAPQFIAAEEVKTSGYLVSAADIAQSAGALQDVSRYVQTLPGAVIGTDDFRNDLIVRGGSPLENLYIVDNVEIPNINTFANFASAGGTVSMLDAALLQDVTFLTGGFPAAFGSRASSVLQVSLREGDRRRTGGRVTFGFAGVGAVAEGGLANGRGSWVLSLRRSVLDWVTDDTGIGGVPVLYTVNGKATYDLSPRDRVWLLNVSGVDRVRLGLTEDSDPTEELSNLDIAYRGRRYATGVNWQRTFGAAGVGLFGATYTRAAVDQRVRDLLRGGIPDPSLSIDEQIARGSEVFREDSTESEVGLKYDLTLNLKKVGKLQAGAAAKRLRTAYDAASPFGSDGPYFVAPDANPFALEETLTTTQSAAYLQLSRSLGRVGVTAGVRGDRFGYLRAWRASPRVGVSVPITSAVTMKGAAGRYYQQPFQLFISAFPENVGVTPFFSDHVIGGVEWRPEATLRLGAEAYVKRYRRYPVSRDVPALSLANIGDTFAIGDVLFPLLSAGEGEAEGVELLAERKAESNARWFGQLNAAFSRTRHAGRDGVLRPGSFDYPVVVNLAGTYRLSDRWSVSTRVSYLSGRPYTPVDVAASTAGRRLVYDLAQVNAVRAPAYFRSDLRLDRLLMVNGRPLTIFFGAQNITNRKNFSAQSWDRRNNVLKMSEQLGLFPILGLDWQF
jgi:hypothetical protein